MIFDSKALWEGMLEEEPVQEGDRPLPWMERLRALPGLGVLLAILCVLCGQTANVLVKKMTLDPILLLLWRDCLRLGTQDAPLLTMVGKNPFPRGSRTLLLVRGLVAGLFVGARCYAVRYLPLADATMLLSVKPAFVTLLSCIFLKEACGVFEMLNLLLVFTGITLVIQPPFIFGSGDTEYTSHMMYTALMMVAVTALSSVVTIILRHLRHMHWVALAGSTRFVTILEFAPLVLSMGTQCVPACGLERLQILFLSCVGTAVQALMILSLKFEEAHIIGLVDSAANIMVAFLFQAIFFSHSAGLMKVLGAVVVLCSVLLIGGRKMWKHKNKHVTEK